MTEFLASLALRARGGAFTAPVLAPDAAARPADVDGRPDPGDPVRVFGDEFAAPAVSGRPSAEAPQDAPQPVDLFAAAGEMDPPSPRGTAAPRPTDAPGRAEPAPPPPSAPSTPIVETFAINRAPALARPLDHRDEIDTALPATPAPMSAAARGPGGQPPAASMGSSMTEQSSASPSVVDVEVSVQRSAAVAVATPRSAPVDVRPSPPATDPSAHPRTPTGPAAPIESPQAFLPPASHPSLTSSSPPRTASAVAEESGEPIVDVRIGRVEVRFDRPRERTAQEPPSRPAGFAGWELARRHLDRRWM